MKLYAVDGRWNALAPGSYRPISFWDAVEDGYRLRIILFAADGSDAGLYGDGLRGSLTGVHGYLQILARGTADELATGFGLPQPPAVVVS